MTISSILLSFYLGYCNSIDFTNLIDMRMTPYQILILIINLLLLPSCSDYSEPEKYPFPPEGADFPFVMHRINPMNGDTISSRTLTSFMFDDGLFFDSDPGHFEVESRTYVRDTSTSNIEIFISNEFGNRALEITESYRFRENGRIKSIISSKTTARFQFKGSKIFFPIVFDGVPSDFIVDCTASGEDVLEWVKGKYGNKN